MDQYKKNQKTMVLQVDKKKKIRLMKKIKKADQKKSWFYYFNLFFFPVMIIISIIVLLVLYLNGYPGILVDTITFFLIFCCLAKLVTSLLNYKIATKNITNLIGESLVLDDNCLTFIRHELASVAGNSVMVSRIFFRDIKKCEYDVKREQVKFYADYNTVDYIGDVPVNSGIGTELTIYDYFNPSLYQVLLSNKINVEVKEYV